MPVNPTIDELYTTVENISGRELFFGFLGPHGARLAPDEVYHVRGDMTAGNGGFSTKKFDALRRSLEAGLLRIRNTPAPVFWDAVAEIPRSIAIVDDVVTVVEPTYAESSS